MWSLEIVAVKRPCRRGETGHPADPTATPPRAAVGSHTGVFGPWSEMMKRMVKWIDTLSGLCGGLAGLMLCAGLGLIVVEIVLRSAFSRTLFITEEYAGYLMCTLTFCALGYTLRDKGHIRMTFLLRVVKGRPRIYLDILCFAIGLVFCAALTYFTGVFFLDSVVSRSQSMQISEAYLAVPQFFMPLGALIMTLQFLGEILRSIALLKGDLEDLELREESSALGR